MYLLCVLDLRDRLGAQNYDQECLYEKSEEAKVGGAVG